MTRGNDRRRNGDPGARRPGREASVRLSGRRGAADLRRHVRAGQGAAHPGAARAGRGARGGRLCALDRQGRLRAGHLRPRRHQCGDRPDRRADGFDPDRLHHRAGADSSDRQRRLPGMPTPSASRGRAPSTIIWSSASRICRACCTRRSTSPPAAGRVRWWSISRRTSSSPRASIPSRRISRTPATSRRSRATSTRSSRRSN